MERPTFPSIKNLWYRLSLRDKLLLFFILIIVLVSFIGLYSYTVAYRYIDGFQLTLQSHYRINSFLLELRKDYSVLGVILKSPLPADMESVYESQERLTVMISQIFKESNTSLLAYFQINALQNALNAYIEKANIAITGYARGDKDYFQAYYQVQRIYTYMEMYTSDLQNIRLTEGWLYYYNLAGKAATTRWLIIIVIACVTLISFRFTFLFSRHFTAPIHTLAELSRRIASGELDVPLIEDPGHEADEIGTLTASFNGMSKSIRTLVEDLKQKSILEKKLHDEEMEKESTLRALREAQLISLQTQIKPHFLFNIMNTIARQAQLEKADRTAELIQSMSNLLRYNLLSHQQSVSLDQELLIVQEYIELQRKRFADRIRFVMRCSVDSGSLLVPPLIIQPFVENSVCHGLEPKVDGGTVHLDIRERDGRCLVRILDTGVGMDTAQKRFLTGWTDRLMEGSTHGIGIRNVIKRLNIYYSGEEKVVLYSRPGRGTFVRISIPRDRRP